MDERKTLRGTGRGPICPAHAARLVPVAGIALAGLLACSSAPSVGGGAPQDVGGRTNDAPGGVPALSPVAPPPAIPASPTRSGLGEGPPPRRPVEPIPLLSPIADRCPVADMGALACEQDPNSAACTACYDDKTASCDAVACKAIATELLSCARAHDCLTPEGLVDWACGLEHCDTGPSSLSAYVECIAGCPKLTQCESSSADRCCGLNQRMDKVFVAKVCKWQICTNEFIRLGSDGTFSQTLVVSWGDIDVARPFADTDHLLSATSDRGVWSTDCDFLTVVRCGGAVRERRHYRYTGAVWRTALYSAGENSALPEQSFSEVDVAFPVAPAGWDEKCR